MQFTRINRRLAGAIPVIVAMFVLASSVTTWAEAAPSMGAGGVFSHPVVGMAGTPDGGGYWLTDTIGEVATNGNAAFFGSMKNQPLNSPIVHIVATPDNIKSPGYGYWLVAADGGVFGFGNAGYYGSMGGQHLNAPIVGLAPFEDGRGTCW
jgi:hypothetical protein